MKVGKVPTGLEAEVIFYIVQQPTKKLHNPSIIINVTALNLNEKLIINQNDKQVVQSGFFTLKRKETPDLREPAQLPLLGRKEVVQALREVKKNLSDNRKTETKHVKKSQNRAPTCTERPITIQNLQR